MKAMQKAFLAISPLLFLGGCETYYKPPRSESTAKIRFTSTAPNQQIVVTLYDSAACDVSATGGIMGVVGGINKDPLGSVPPEIKAVGNTLNMIGYSDGFVRPIERLVPAKKNLTFATFRLVNASMSGGFIHTETCVTTYQIHPEPGQEYEIKYDEGSNYCVAQGFRLAIGPKDDIQRIPEPTFRKGPLQCSGREAIK